MTMPVIAMALLLLWLPRLVHPLGRRISPGDWCFTSRRSLAAGSVALGLSILGLTMPTLSRALGEPMLAQWCDELLSHLPHGGAVTRWLASLLVAATLSWGSLSFVRARRALRGLYVPVHVGTHIRWRAVDVVLLSTTFPVAYSRLKPHPQIVVSNSLVESLDEMEMELLLLHELAHLSNKDERTLLALSVLEEALRWIPGIRESANIVRVSVERVADEVAAGREPVRRGALCSAIIKTASFEPLRYAPAFSSTLGLRERIRAMRDEAQAVPESRTKWVLGVAALLRISGTTAATACFILLLGLCST